MPLEAEWIRNFMLQRDNAAQHLQVLTAPIPNEKACLYSEVLLFQGLQSVLPAVWSVTSACLMLPCASNGSNEVGLVVRREERLRNHANSSSAVNQESHLITEHTVGRYVFVLLVEARPWKELECPVSAFQKTFWLAAMVTDIA